VAAEQEGAFKGRHFASDVILWALRWYLAFPISYRDVVLMRFRCKCWWETRQTKSRPYAGDFRLQLGRGLPRTRSGPACHDRQCCELVPS
jgi:hypothetical protein